MYETIIFWPEKQKWSIVQDVRESIFSMQASDSLLLDNSM